MAPFDIGNVLDGATGLGKTSMPGTTEVAIEGEVVHERERTDHFEKAGEYRHHPVGRGDMITDLCDAVLKLLPPREIPLHDASHKGYPGEAGGPISPKR